MRTQEEQNDRRRLQIANFRDDYSTCNACTLSECRERVALPRGRIYPHVMVIGEHPNDSDNKQGKAWTGPAGRLLQEVEEQGRYCLREEDADKGILPRVWYTHTVLCYPLFYDGMGQADVRSPTNDETNACLERLIEEIYLLDPIVLFLMGELPARILAGQRKKMRSIAATFHQVNLEYRGCRMSYPAFIAHSPTFLLRSDAAQDPNGPTRLTFDLYRRAVELALYIEQSRAEVEPIVPKFLNKQARQLGSL